MNGLREHKSPIYSYFDGRVSTTVCGFRPQTITSLLPAVTDEATSFSA